MQRQRQNNYQLEDGTPIYSVTELLQMHGFVPPRRGGQQGTIIHDMIANYLANNIIPVFNNDHEMTCFNNAITYLENSKATILDVEKRLYDIKYLFTGQPDIIVIRNGDKGIIDWKTGDEMKHHILQMAGYSLLCPCDFIVIAYLKTGIFIERSIHDIKKEIMYFTHILKCDLARRVYV